MRRGTTPTLIIKVKDGELTKYETVLVMFRQDRKQVNVEGDVVDDETVKVYFTQEDTLAYANGAIEVQLKAKTYGGKVVASNIVSTPMKEILSEVIL